MFLVSPTFKYLIYTFFTIYIFVYDNKELHKTYDANPLKVYLEKKNIRAFYIPLQFYVHCTP